MLQRQKNQLLVNLKGVKKKFEKEKFFSIQKTEETLFLVYSEFTNVNKISNRKTDNENQKDVLSRNCIKLLIKEIKINQGRIVFFAQKKPIDVIDLGPLDDILVIILL